MRWTSKTWRDIQHALLPHYCPMCEAASITQLCSECVKTLPLIDQPCDICSVPLVKDLYSTGRTASHLTCADCQKSIPHFRKAICAYEYSGNIPQAISLFKDQAKWSVATQLGAQLISSIRSSYTVDELPDSLVPVPLYWRRHWQRGFNQAHMIAQQLSIDLNIPITKAIRKITPTHAQKHLNKSQRLKNLAQSFDVAPNILEGKHIAIVDDVMTTGATANLLAKICQAAGAKYVDAWALARTPKN